MLWHLSHRSDSMARPLADRHYNRQKIGAVGFVPPGSCLVLLTENADALWVTSAPIAEYVKHEWAGAWVCSCFRNEGPELASVLNMQAVAATRDRYGEPPCVKGFGFISFIDRSKVKPVMIRGKKVWGWTWLKCGWEVAGETKSGLLALGLRKEKMAPPEAALPRLPRPVQLEPSLFDCLEEESCRR